MVIVLRTLWSNKSTNAKGVSKKIVRTARKVRKMRKVSKVRTEITEISENVQKRM